tara:strand:+ start:40 stop:417 length:378 start_codon:yes stop_codon:yes gene_type:complete
MTVIKFPRNICIPLKYEKPLPRQRVFYLGIVYTGPPLCQDVTELYLKRHGKIDGKRKWSLITYGKYDEFDKRNYSIELDICDEDDVPDMLCQFYIGNHITFDDLRKFGWNGKVFNNAKIIDFKKD